MVEKLAFNLANVKMRVKTIENLKWIDGVRNQLYIGNDYLEVSAPITSQPAELLAYKGINQQ
jgi:hypothetical protein